MVDLEKRRKNFVFYLRTINSHYLKRIAESYDTISQALVCSESFICDDKNFRNDVLHEDLRRVQMKGCTINGRRVTYKQAGVIHELIYGGMYGGYFGDGKSLKSLAISNRSIMKEDDLLEEVTDSQ